MISSPEIFLAHAAAQTDHIKLGAGVVSLPYHNPLWVADRAILLDHLTRGRFLLGLGPGALPTDAAMIGMDPAEQRPALDEDVAVLMQLLPPTSRSPSTRPATTWSRPAASCAPSPTPVSKLRWRPSPRQPGPNWPAGTDCPALGRRHPGG